MTTFLRSAPILTCEYSDSGDKAGGGLLLVSNPSELTVNVLCKIFSMDSGEPIAQTQEDIAPFHTIQLSALSIHDKRRRSMYASVIVEGGEVLATLHSVAVEGWPGDERIRPVFGIELRQQATSIA